MVYFIMIPRDNKQWPWYFGVWAYLDNILVDIMFVGLFYMELDYQKLLASVGYFTLSSIQRAQTLLWIIVLWATIPNAYLIAESIRTREVVDKYYEWSSWWIILNPFAMLLIDFMLLGYSWYVIGQLFKKKRKHSIMRYRIYYCLILTGSCDLLGAIISVVFREEWWAPFMALSLIESIHGTCTLYLTHAINVVVANKKKSVPEIVSSSENVQSPTQHTDNSVSPTQHMDNVQSPTRHIEHLVLPTRQMENDKMTVHLPRTDNRT